MVEVRVRVHHETDQFYHLGDFRVQEDSPDAPRHLADAHEPTRRLPSGHRSQSEADWAYAKRALARGDAEEMVRIRPYAEAVLVAPSAPGMVRLCEDERYRRAMLAAATGGPLRGQGEDQPA